MTCVQRILRLKTGEALPFNVSFVKLLHWEDVPIGTGTNTERVYTVLVEDRRAR